MRRENLEHLVTTGMIEGKFCRLKMLKKDSGWTDKIAGGVDIEEVTNALKATRN